MSNGSEEQQNNHSEASAESNDSNDLENLDDEMEILSLCEIGAVVECDLPAGVVKGRILTSGESKILLEAFEAGQRYVYVVNPKFVRSIKQTDAPNPDLISSNNDDYDTDAAEERLKNKQKERNGIKVSGISLTGLETFALLKKLYQHAKWQGKSILVFDSIRINPPYSSEHVEMVDSNPRAQDAKAQICKAIQNIPSAVEQSRKLLEAHGITLPVK